MPNWLIIGLLVIAIIITLFIIVSTCAQSVFKQKAAKEIKRLLQDFFVMAEDRITKEELSRLPVPVQKWLENTHILGKERITTVRLKQTGQMRTKPGAPWMAVAAEQYFRVDQPEFVWIAKVKMAPFFHLSGLDRYVDGKGKMNIKLLSLIPVVDATGPEIDQGTLLRYLGEMQWFPTAALNPYIKWEAIDETNAKATMTYKGVSASAVFTFTEQGDIVRFMAKRYRDVNGKYVLSDWGGVSREFKQFNGIRIPSKSDVIWVDDTGEEFNWFQCEIVGIEYN
jgi:hypothetical protein